MLAGGWPALGGAWLLAAFWLRTRASAYLSGVDNRYDVLEAYFSGPRQRWGGGPEPRFEA